jgi:hypothetical protein
VDLEESRGGNVKLEMLLAQRLMRESALLMRTLLAYAVGDSSTTEGHSSLYQPGRALPPPTNRDTRTERVSPPVKGREVSKKETGFWAGDGVTIEENTVRRVKRNVFGDVFHQLFGLATDEELQQQLRVDEDLRDKVASTLTRQVYFEKELVAAIGNLSVGEDKALERIDVLEEKMGVESARRLRMDGHRFTLMEDVDRLEDILEAVVTGVVNTRHAAFLSSKAGLSRVATFEFVNVTASKSGVTVRYLTRLYQMVTVEEISSNAVYSRVRTPSRDYFLHVSHGAEMPVTELEVQGTRDECEMCAVLVHTGSRRYLAVIPGVVTCVSGVQGEERERQMEVGEVVILERGDICKNKRMLVTDEGRHITRYTVTAAGADPLDSMVLQRREKTDRKLDGSHSVTDSHAALNIHLRQNLGMAQQDIDNLIRETQQSFKLYTVTSSSTFAWLTLISVLAILLVLLIVRKFCQKMKESRLEDDTVFIPPLVPPRELIGRPCPPLPRTTSHLPM